MQQIIDAFQAISNLLAPSNPVDRRLLLRNFRRSMSLFAVPRHTALASTRSDSSQIDRQSDGGARRKSTIHRSIYRQPQKKILCLDLDETLVHSTPQPFRRHDFSVEVVMDKHTCLYYVFKRPHCDLFLQKVSEWYTVVIFTASMAEYADPVIDWLDPSKTLISKRYFRDSCIPSRGHFLKNLAHVETDISQVCV